MEIFKERLKSLRKQQNLTQTDVAKQLKIAQPSYVRYEKGTAEPSFENLVKLANLLNTTVDYLLGMDKIEKSNNH